MKVSELREILEGYPPELEVELVIVCPVDSPGDPVEVDRYEVGAVLTWQGGDGGDDDDELAWLVGGEEDDLEAFIDATGLEDHDHDHDHDHEEHGDGDAAG